MNAEYFQCDLYGYSHVQTFQSDEGSSMNFFLIYLAILTLLIIVNQSVGARHVAWPIVIVLAIMAAIWASLVIACDLLLPIKVKPATPPPTKDQK